jgi:TatD DNase family protein
MIVVGTDLLSSQKAVALSEKYPFLFATVGLHPHDAERLTTALLSELETLSHHPKVVGIGETGLDFYYNHASHESQLEAFSAQITIAVKRRLPLVIHTREAWDASFQCLEKVDPRYLKDVGSVFHCFTGNHEIATRAVQMGLSISFSGIVTFPKTASLQEAASLVDARFLLLETDAPFLSPQGYRGKRNEPAFLTVTAEKVAALRGCSVEMLAATTTQNANRIFKFGHLLS